MSWTLFRYVVRTYLAAFAGILLATLTIFLVADFVDRATMYVGPHWVTDASILYANKALLAVRQLGPAALLLAAGATVSLLRRRGELTAMASLTVGPSALYLPVGACALCICAALAVFDEAFVVDAGRRVDEIYVTKFNRWGDWRFYFTPQKWFRRGDRIFYLRGGDPDGGFQDVTLLQLTSDFRLKQRLDARRLSYLGGTKWSLEGVVERTFTTDGDTQVTTATREELDLGTTDRPFRIRQGRPEQMRFAHLREQIRARREAGLSIGQYSLALQNRLAYPFAGLPAALVAVGLALRPNRKGHLTAALVEGLAVSVFLWGMMVILKTLVLAQHIDAGTAAWAPVTLLAACALALWARRDGLLARP